MSLLSTKKYAKSSEIVYDESSIKSEKLSETLTVSDDIVEKIGEAYDISGIAPSIQISREVKGLYIDLIPGSVEKTLASSAFVLLDIDSNKRIIGVEILLDDEEIFKEIL